MLKFAARYSRLDIVLGVGPYALPFLYNDVKVSIMSSRHNAFSTPYAEECAQYILGQ
jgi:hypothetical protein